MKEKTVEMQNLSIGYTTKKQIKPIAGNLCSMIYSGELTCLLGANGVGKSTLLRTLSNFQPKLAGKIFIQGKEIDTYSDKALSRTVGVVLTERTPAGNLSVKELIGLGRNPYTGFWGKLNKQDEEIIWQSIERVKIKKLAHRPVQTLSDGERQKVMIAKTLAQETPIIYLDEPTAFLDFPSKVEIMRLLLNLTRQSQKTVFLSTHDLELALQVADKIWLMDNETGITAGTPEELRINGRLEKFFQCDGLVFDRKNGLFRIDKSAF